MCKKIVVYNPVVNKLLILFKYELGMVIGDWDGKK